MCVIVMVVSVEGSLPTNVIAGMMSGIMSSSIANPTDVLKVMLIYLKSRVTLGKCCWY